MWGNSLKKVVKFIVFILVLISLGICIYFLVDNVILTKNDTTKENEHTTMSITEQLRLQDKIDSLNADEILPDMPSMTTRAENHLNSINPSASFKELPASNEVETTVEVPEQTVVNQYILIADIKDIRTEKYKGYVITVNNDRTYKVDIVKGNDNKISFEDILGEGEFVELKNLLKLYSSLHLMSTNKNDSDYYTDIMVELSNTPEETLVWLANILLGESAEKINQDTGITVSINTLEDIRTYVERKFSE